MNFRHVEDTLRARLEKLERRLDHVTIDIRKSHSRDSTEQAVERENDEVLQGIEQEVLTSIADIHAALGRIDAGSYGSCSRCGKSINPDRLDVLPETVYCLGCVPQ